MKITAIIVLSSFLVLACTGNTNNTSSSIDEWDVDGDSRLDSEEYSSVFDDLGVFEGWDKNSDHSVDTTEWGNQVRQHLDYNSARHGNYADWDADTDKGLDKDELSEKVFKMYDVDGDGYIESREYERWYYGMEKEPEGQ